MSDGHVRIAYDGYGKYIDNAVFQREGVEIHRQRVETYSGTPANIDTAGRTRSSSVLTLFDGKIMGAEDTYKWDTKGTGTAAYTSNAMQMTVTAGQYAIRQAKYFLPYFSGKPQLIESTSIDFQNQAGIVKRIGYYSSNAVAPYDSDKDGWWLEADGTTHRLICSNNGTITHNIPFESWDAYPDIAAYDWSKFTVTQVDFLWLGGAALRMFMVIDGAFKLVHTIDTHAGYASGLIFNSPNQPVRYEIRSTSGAGTLTAVCSQVATEGTGTNEMGEGIATYSAIRTANTVGTIYPLLGARKQAVFRNHYCPVAFFGAAILSPDAGMILLMLNPTQSAPMVWTNDSRIQFGMPALNSTITNPGRILKAVPIVESGQLIEAPSAMLRNLSVGIDNLMSEVVVAYAPQTANQSVVGSMQVVEY